jgi:tetratricopeptide (TPR) repeat protein
MITTTVAAGHRPLSVVSPQVLTGAARLIETREYAEAIAMLEAAVESDPSPATHALLGTAYLLTERYPQAAQQLTTAVAGDPTNEDWQGKLALASANAVAHVEEDYPPVVPFDREALLAAPALQPGSLPSTPSGKKHALPLGAAIAFAAKVTGVAVTAFTDAASELAGRLGTSDAVWTNWYRKGLVLGVATLQAMRDRLDERNLIDPYPNATLTAFQPHGLVPPPGKG